MSTPPTHQKISQIRARMAQMKIDAVIIPSDDPHKSEYVAEHWQARKWLTGFSGSAGTALVTKDHAILWTDFRYYIQAEEQIKSSEFVLFKAGEADVPALEKWLVKNLPSGSVIGLDGALFSKKQIDQYEEKFDIKSFTLDTGVDIISDIWQDRPAIPQTEAFLFSEHYAGESRSEKMLRIRKKMEGFNTGYHLMVSLEDIAWALNLRGSDVHTNPVNIAFLLIEPETLTLFIDAKKIDEQVRSELESDQVEICPYQDIDDYLRKIQGESRILLDPETVSVRLFNAIPDTCRIVEKTSPVVALKAIKNEVQIKHMEDTAIKDGVAMVQFLHWLETQTGAEPITEISVAEKLFEIRQEQNEFIDNSFDPIMAYEDHSAICHYSATAESDREIGSTGMFLNDSGGNYLTGTTDITRTISRSAPTKQQIKDYTLVLKGHIAVAACCFPKGTRGVQIDTLARQYLWQNGYDFGHGTGHGVGFFLCVHEGPARISPFPVDEVLKKGMLLTNEPGIYREGDYGIRLENMILVQEAFESEFGPFLEFEQMTLCHFERGLIDLTLMTQQEKEWLNTYHQTVYEKVAPGLDDKTAAWLKEKTTPL